MSREWCEHMVYGQLIRNAWALKCPDGGYIPISIHDGWKHCPICAADIPEGPDEETVLNELFLKNDIPVKRNSIKLMNEILEKFELKK